MRKVKKSTLVVLCGAILVMMIMANAVQASADDNNGAVGYGWGGVDEPTPIKPKALTVDGSPLTVSGGDGRYSDPSKGTAVLPNDDPGPRRQTQAVWSESRGCYISADDDDTHSAGMSMSEYWAKIYENEYPRH